MSYSTSKNSDILLSLYTIAFILTWPLSHLSMLREFFLSLPTQRRRDCGCTTESLHSCRGTQRNKKKIVVDKLRSTKNNEQDQYSLRGLDFATWDAKMDRS